MRWCLRICDGFSDGRGRVRCRLERGFPRRGCGRESGCKDAFDQLLFPRVPLRYALPDPMWRLSALAPARDSQRQRKEKQFNAITTPITSAPSATGQQSRESQKAIACPKVRQNRRLHRYADPRRARRATAPERVQSGLFFWTVHGPFSFPQDGRGPRRAPRGGERRSKGAGAVFAAGGNGAERTLRRRQWGVHPGWTSPLAGARPSWPPFGGPSRVTPAGRCVPANNPW